MKRCKAAPDEERDYEKIPANIEPDGIHNEPDDKGRGDGEKEEKILSPHDIFIEDIAYNEKDESNEPDERDADSRDEPAVDFLSAIKIFERLLLGMLLLE